MSMAVVIVVCLIAAVEGMDASLMGSSQQAFFLDVDGWDMWHQGDLGMGQGIAQNAGAVVWGIAADRGWMPRRSILCFAALMQALCTISLAFVSTVGPMWPIRLLNGFFLAALRPISNGIVADLASAPEQGYYFGLMQGCFAVGNSATGAIVGPVAEALYDLPVLGPTRGWRLAFVLVSSVAIAASAFSFFRMPNIPAAPMTEEEKQQSTFAAIAYELKALFRFLKYPSFILMITQGVFGSIPWLVVGNLNLYARLSGFEEWTLGVFGIVGIVGVAGGFIGGLVSDFLVTKVGPAGRPLSAVLTVSCATPLMFTLYYLIPPGSALQNVYVFAVILTIWNLTGHWAQPGCNFPVLGQIVTGKDRNKVMCWELCFENSMALIIGSRAVPQVIAWLGSEDIKYEGETDLELARTLGIAQAIVMCVPNVVCFLVYCSLMWSFPIDVKRVEAEKASETGAGAVDDTELVAGEFAS